MFPLTVIHFISEKNGAICCGGTALPGCLTKVGPHVSCPDCLARMALDDPLLLLTREEAELVRRARRLRSNEDYALLVHRRGGHLYSARVLPAGGPLG